MNRPADDLKRGIIYTFYSFKGGTGRTMALANVAALMAKWECSVLVVDWDLEAPGIERYFASSTDEARGLRASRPGIADIMHAWAQNEELDWRKCVIKFKQGVSVITAGREDGEYTSRIQRLDFDALFKEHNLGKYIERLRTEWAESFDFVLIDSRTGVTDIGGICTVHLPDILVLFFTANDSSTEGAVDVVTRARIAQEHLPLDRAHLLAVPVPSRDETRTEYNRAAEWKRVFAERFSGLYRDWLPKRVSPHEAVELLRIPYVPYWSFGEQLPVLLEGTTDTSSLGYAYEFLARLLVNRLDWSESVEGRKVAPLPDAKPRQIDKNWLERRRNTAMSQLTQSRKPGFMEVYHFCLDSAVTKSQTELLEIAEQASVHTFGWPIGVVLRTREEFRPRPSNDGITADIDTGHDYDYWALRTNGDFYTLMSLFEDDRTEKTLFFDTRIVRITEAILHCINVYKAMGVESNGTVSLTCRHGGLRGRKLLAASPNRAPSMHSRQNLNEDVVESSVAFRIGVNEPEITSLVKSICEPLFVVFDFAKFRDEIYQEIVSNFIQGRVI
jgi:MinD-like ATPase involved in chromosome partitioning or flagellar assembly